MARNNVTMSSTENPRVPLLQLMMGPLFSGKTLTLKVDKRDAVAVVALQRHLSEQQNDGPGHALDSYSFDVTLTDGVCQVKCHLDRGLNNLVHTNVLRSGIDIYINQCSFVYNEKILGQGFVSIDRLECSSRRSDILPKVKDVDSLPLLSKDGGASLALQTDAPLQVGRKHYLPLWNNEDPEGRPWAPNSTPPDVVLDVSRIILLCDLETSLGHIRRPPPVVVKVIHKSRLRYYGKFGLKIDYPYQAYFEVADQSGSMSLVLWNELCPEWYQRLNVGTVLYLQDYTLKPSYANRSWPHIDRSRMKTFHSVEICLNPWNPKAAITVVPPKSVSPQWGLPDVTYQFTTRSELDNLTDNSVCDVIGLVTFVGRVERVKHKGNTGPEKYWSYRWVHAVDGTSSLPFIMEIFASSQPEIFNEMCPMTYLVSTHMRVCHVEGSLPYLTSSCETRIFITGCHRGQPYVSDPTVKSFIQWTKTQKDSIILKRVSVGGHYCFPHPPRIFTQSMADGSAQVPLVAASDLEKELKSLQYREHKRLAMQGKIIAVQYLKLPAEALSVEGQSEESVGVTNAADLLSDQRTAEMQETHTNNRETLPSGDNNSNSREKRKRPKRREVKRFYITRARMQARSESEHGLAEAEPGDLEESESEEEEEEEEDDPLGAEQVSTDRDRLSWESDSWPNQNQEVCEHLHAGGLDSESLTQKFKFDDQDRLLQLGNLHPARWTPGQTTGTILPLSCKGYYQITILGVNHQVAIDAVFVPVVSTGDPRAVGLLQDPHDNTLLSCLSAGFLCPLHDPESQSEEAELPEPEEILATAEELKETHLVCILELCHLGGDKVEVLINKVYRMTDVALI